MRRGADIDASSQYRGGGQGLFSQVVLRQNGESVTRLKDVGESLFIDQDYLVTGNDGGHAEASLEAFLPDKGPIGGVQTHGDARVTHQVQAAIVIDRRGDMGSSSLMQPAQVGLRNVSPAPGAQGQDGAVATGGGIDQASPGDNRGNGFLGWPRQRPEFPARIRMIALYVKGTIVDEFILIGHAHDHRVGPPHGLSTVMLPKHRSGLLIQGHENRFTSVLILNENDLVTIEYRAGSRSMHRGEITDVLLPQKLPIHVIAHKTAITEEGDDAFSVRHRRRRRIGILTNDSLDRLGRGSRPLPLQFASRSRKAEQFPDLAVF